MGRVQARDIITTLVSERSLSVAELADKFETHPVAVDQCCYRLQQNGYIKQTGNDGIYSRAKNSGGYIQDDN
jgi:DNA-binding IclR family transcriptional regulator